MKKMVGDAALEITHLSMNAGSAITSKYATAGGKQALIESPATTTNQEATSSDIVKESPLSEK